VRAPGGCRGTRAHAHPRSVGGGQRAPRPGSRPRAAERAAWPWAVGTAGERGPARTMAGGGDPAEVAAAFHHPRRRTSMPARCYATLAGRHLGREVGRCVQGQRPLLARGRNGRAALP
jgi:hypothetical protein